MLTKTLFAAAASLALGLAASAHAGPRAASSDSETISVRVSLIDLNLDREAGAKVALRRIRNAAAIVCGGDLSPSLRNLSSPYQACQRDAIDRAVATLAVPTVSALNARRTAKVQVARR